MTIQNAIDHNNQIDHFINVTLKHHFGGDKIKISQWFEAQNLIRAQNFYEKGAAILKDLRAQGLAVTMDMQSNKLHAPALGLRAY